MSKPAKKGTKILIGFLIAAILMAICFLCVALYAKNEFNKERSWLPLKFEPQQASATELPDNAPEALDYALCLYDDALHGDSVEISCRTDVDLGGDMKLPFADADNAIIDRIRSGAAGAVEPRDANPEYCGAELSGFGAGLAAFTGAPHFVQNLVPSFS